MTGLLRLIAWPLGRATRLTWFAVRITRLLPKRIRILVVDAVEGHPLRRSNVVLEQKGACLEVDTGDDVGRRILFRSYEVEELALLDTLVGPGDTCIDVGANLGLYTVSLARLVGPNGRVLAFEADPRNAKKLRRNISLNSFEDRVAVHEVALLDSAGTIEFNQREPGFSGHGSVHRYPGHVASVTVPTVALDAVLEQAGLDDVALLKVDVEGADMDVYAGAQHALERQVFRAILAEWNGYWFPGLGWSVERFLAFFAECGYQPTQGVLKAWDQLAQDPVGLESAVVNVLFKRSATSGRKRYA